jgi:hypothetical protein
MGDQLKKRRRARIRLVVALFVLYPLSIGPAYALCVEGKWFSTVYAPVIWPAKLLGCSDTIVDYMIWCDRQFGSSPYPTSP